MNSKIFEFDEYLIDFDEKRLFKNGQTVSLQPKVFELLIFLIERRGELISRDDLMNALWKDTFVEETNLRFCIHSLRKALGKKPDGKDFIETVPKHGYRFVAAVREITGQIIPANIVESDANPPPAPTIKKTLLSRWMWLFGISTIAFGGLVILAFYLSREAKQSPKNALGIGNLAVLPFMPVGENDVDLQTGLTDALTTNLGKIKNLNVLPIASTRQYIGKEFKPSAVGRELSADAVLDGSYRIEGEKARVTAKLLRVANDETLWEETFELEKTGNIELENFISLRTARLISLKIADAEDEQMLKTNKNLNPEAVGDYLSAGKIRRKGELFRRDEIFALYEKAIALEPSWASAYASYAETLLSLEEFSSEREKIELIAQKAVELDNNLPQPHAVFGEIYHYFDWNWQKAETEFKKAVSLDPNYALAHYKFARFLMLQRRFSEAEDELDRAVELEPFSPLYHAGLCELYSADRKFDKALAACLYAKQIEPEFWQIQKLLFWIYVERKMYKELDEMILSKLSPAERAAHPLTKSLAEKDLRPFWQSLIDETLKGKNDNPVNLAEFYLQIGEKEKALNLIEKALQQRDSALPMISADSNFDSIRNDDRFIKVMQTINLQK